MNWIYKLFKKNPDSREDIITVTSGLGMAINLLIAILKVITGIMASSIAIISEGTNNAADALSSALTLIGTKLAAKRPDKDHPFGYGRIEYLTGMVISVIILTAGIEMLKNSIELIIHPEELNISMLSLVIVAVSACIKLVLGSYTIRMGKKAESAALEAVGIECRSDSIVSVITIVSAVIFLASGISIDAYAGAVTSLFIIKAGFDVLRTTVSDIIGRPGEKELAHMIYDEIRKTDGVLFAVDMMLHNYGPDAWSGSVNIEIDHKKTIGEVYEVLHKLQLRIMHEYKVIMVFGIYAVDNDSDASKTLRKVIGHFIHGEEHVMSFHAVYIDKEAKRIYVDFIVDYDIIDWDSLEARFKDYMAKEYPDYSIELTIETEFV